MSLFSCTPPFWLKSLPSLRKMSSATVEANSKVDNNKLNLEIMIFYNRVSHICIYRLFIRPKSVKTLLFIFRTEQTNQLFTSDQINFNFYYSQPNNTNLLFH